MVGYALVFPKIDSVQSLCFACTPVKFTVRHSLIFCFMDADDLIFLCLS